MERTTEIQSVLWLGTAVMLFLAVGLILLVLFYQNSFSKMKRLEAEALLKASLESEQSERRRIAADLHDGVCGDLGAIRNYLQLLKKDAAVKDQHAIGEIGESVENALENTRLVSYKLMPPLLTTQGLSAAITDNFERLTKKTAIPFTSLSDGKPDLPPTAAYELFRVIQEFTANMLKYGNISGCTVTISDTPAAAIIKISDDGRPYHFKTLKAASSGSGLNNIDSRLKMIGAALEQHDTETGNLFTITLKK